MTDPAAFQESYNDRFGCCICLGPKLKMVYGQCQHRVCEDCLYVGKERRPCMQNCPICNCKNSFPKQRPKIPQTELEIQACLGVQVCPNKCSTQLWFWEVDEHLKSCGTKLKQSERCDSKGSPLKKRRRNSCPISPGEVSLRVTRQSQQSNIKPAVISSRTRSHTRSHRS